MIPRASWTLVVVHPQILLVPVLLAALLGMMVEVLSSSKLSADVQEESMGCPRHRDAHPM